MTDPNAHDPHGHYGRPNAHAAEPYGPGAHSQAAHSGAGETLRLGEQNNYPLAEHLQYPPELAPEPEVAQRRDPNPEGVMWSRYAFGILLTAGAAVVGLMLVNIALNVITNAFTTRELPGAVGARTNSFLWYTSDSSAILAFCFALLAGGLYVAVYKGLDPETRRGAWRTAQLLTLVGAPLSVWVIAPLQPGTWALICEMISRFVVALIIVKGVALFGGKGLRDTGTPAGQR